MAKKKFKIPKTGKLHLPSKKCNKIEILQAKYPNRDILEVSASDGTFVGWLVFKQAKVTAEDIQNALREKS